MPLQTNPLAQSAVKNDDGCNDPYNTFFTRSKSSLPSPLPKHSAIRRLRAALSSRVLHHDQTKSTLKEKSRAGNHDEECDGMSHSENVSSGTAERRNDKDKQREQPVDHEQTFSPYGLSFPSELDSDENRALWKSILRTRKMDGKKVPARQIQHPSPKGVEVSAVRGFQRIIVHKRKRKTKSLAPISSDPTFLVDAGGSSQVAPSSYGDLAHAFISSQGRAGPSSQRIPIAGHVSRSWSTVTNCADDSYSDCSTIQGPWLRFLDKICFSC